MLLLLAFSANAQEIRLIRACNGGNDNLITWRSSPNPCVLNGLMSLYARDAASSLFYNIDSNITANPSGQYSHINANVPSVKDWEYFLVYRMNCGTGNSDYISDTISIDITKPDSTLLDSASVDPITNVVHLGWRSNKTPDFSAYYLYNYDRADPRVKENFRDTFYHDNPATDPKSKSLSYDITSSDSCDNRKDYGKYPHKTILLQGSIDTCVNNIQINWNLYVGWTNDSQQIYRSINGGSFDYLSTVGSTVTTYIDKALPITSASKYFIRAYGNHLGARVSASSNSTNSFSAGKSKSPANTEIGLVTNNGSNIEITIAKDPAAAYSNVELFRSTNGFLFSYIHNFGATNNTLVDPTANVLIRNKYYSISYNVCGQASDTTLISGNIVLEGEENLGIHILKWNPYSTWNSGVKEYLIYRSTGTNDQSLGVETQVGSNASDTFFVSPAPDDNVCCYKIRAERNAGIEASESNKYCFYRTGKVYFPNAIVVHGTNNRFTFMGIGVNLKESSFQIYNRWGQVVYATDDATDGWNGQGIQNDPLPSGVYFFRAKVKVGDQIENINGNITIIE